MAGTIHKISAGCGYEYLTRQVAAMDATDKGRITLADYYSAKGESPGRWIGAGLDALSPPTSPVDSGLHQFGVTAGDVVTAEQMRALFGEGRHPNADSIEQQVARNGGTTAEQLAASALGQRWEESTAQPEFRVRLAEAFVAHNLDLDKAWDSPIPDETKAAMRTALATTMFREVYRRDPADDRELSGYMARINRPAPQGVAGYDLTFSPVKSVSTLWALGYQLPEKFVVDSHEMDVSEVIEHAHDRAVADAISFIESQAAFGRVGAGGIQQLDCQGLIGTAFTHRDARSGDPDLHTHVAIANKVRVRKPTGEDAWVALDGTPLYKAIVSASEVYNSRVETYLRDMLGVSFRAKEQPDKSKRPIREIAGVPQSLMARWSQRRAAIEVETATLAEQFQADHGREPTSTEMFELAQKATLSTREAKHEPRSLLEQRQQWSEQARAELGSDESVLAALGSVLGTDTDPRRTERLDPTEQSALAGSVLEVVSQSRARWQRPHLRAEAERQLRLGPDHSIYRTGPDSPDHLDQTHPLPWRGWLDPAQWSYAVESIVAHAESLSISQARDVRDGDLGEPMVLRRANGESVYTTHDTGLFTNAEILGAERRIVAASRRTDGHTVEDIHVELALLEQAANGRALNAGQTTLVRELATSGRRVQVALAPAGTGKTTAMRAFGRAWEDSGGTVIGLAPTAAAAAVLREDLGTETDTLAKLVQLVRDQQKYEATVEASQESSWINVPNSDAQDRRQRAQSLIENGEVRPPKLPEWFTKLDNASVIVVDEAGMASTSDLDVLIAFAQSRGAAVRLVGDDQQLASISAGGVLRDVAHETGALTLSEVVRFSDTAEGTASLALRDGDPAALGFLADEHRIHVAADTVAAEQAFRAWVHDKDSGHDAVMLAATRETTNHLNHQARAHRLAGTDLTGPEKALSDGLHASVGDIVCTRRNERTLRMSATDWVRNGDRWEVTDISNDGSITVRHLDRGRQVTLPADYVENHVTLGYASTIHAAQGMTADYCHVVGSDSLSRQLFYVAMTRGRHGNHVYLSTAEADPHKVLTPKALSPQTAIEVLTKVLERDEAQRSATTGEREARDPATRLGPALATLTDATGTLAEAQIGPQRLTELAALAEDLHPSLLNAEAWPVLRKHLAQIDLTDDAAAALTAAVNAGELDTAGDPAAVVDWRLGTHTTDGPLPWIPPVPAALAASEHADYLQRRADLVQSLAADIAATARGWTVRSCPPWARPYVAAHADTILLADLAVFRAATQVAETDTRPAGPPQQAVIARTHQRLLEQRAARIVAHNAATERWSTLAHSIDEQLTADPYWPRLADELAALHRAGIDVEDLVRTESRRAELPTEMPAAALWWRISRSVDLPSLQTQDSGLRPDWINTVADVLGTTEAEIVIADPQWPALVTAISNGVKAGWSPRELLETTSTMLAAAVEDAGELLHPHELARALTWRSDMLLSPTIEVAEPPTEPPLTPEEEEELAHFYPDTATEPAEQYQDYGTEVDYLQAVTTQPEPEATDPPPEAVYDTWDELDFTDFATQRPPHSGAPSRDLGQLVADHYELTARHSEVSQQISELTAAIAEHRSPHLNASAHQITELRAIATAQQPAATEVEWAEEDHLEAAVSEAELRTALTETSHQISVLRTEIAEGLHPIDDTRRLDPDHLAPDDHLFELISQQRLLQARVAAASGLTSSYASHVLDAHAALAAVVEQTGGQRVLPEDVNTLRLAASAQDQLTLTQLRDERTSLENQLWRTENALAHRHAITRIATAPPGADLPAEHTEQQAQSPTGDRTRVPTTGPDRRRIARTILLEAEEADRIAHVIDFLAADEVRQVSDKNLATTIATLRRRITRTETDLVVSSRIPADNESRVQRSHARLDSQVAAIHAAREAESQVHSSARILDQARTQLNDHLSLTPPRGRVQEHDQRRRQLAGTLERAQRVHTDLQRKFDQARTSVGAPLTRWDALIEEAHPEHKKRELRAAAAEDSAITDAAAKDRSALRSAKAKLSRALEESTRRSQLSDTERVIEQQTRSHNFQHHDATRSTQRPAVATPLVTPPPAGHQSDRSTDLGL